MQVTSCTLCTMHFLFALAQILAKPSPALTQAREAGLRLTGHSANIQKFELNQTTKTFIVWGNRRSQLRR